MPTSNSAYLPIEGTDFYEKIHKEITSLIASEKKKGTTKDDIQLQVNVYLNQQINELRASMEKEGLPAQKIEETATTTFHQMNRIVMEIMKNSWLQDLKNECEALIEDEQEKKTASKMILKQVNVLIDQKIKALELRNENEKLSQEEQIYHKLFAEVRKSIGPLLLEKQVEKDLRTLKLTINASHRNSPPPPSPSSPSSPSPDSPPVLPRLFRRP